MNKMKDFAFKCSVRFLSKSENNVPVWRLAEVVVQNTVTSLTVTSLTVTNGKG